MLELTPIACLLVGSGVAPAIAEVCEDDPVRPKSLYEIMRIGGGVKIVVKSKGRPMLVRLIGVDTPRRSVDARVDILGRRKFRGGLLPIGGKVRLEAEEGQHADR